MLFFVTVTGMCRFWAYFTAASRLWISLRNRSSFHGAMIVKLGSSAIAVTSNRTWSLPLPVAPWAIASAPTSWATRTCS